MEIASDPGFFVANVYLDAGSGRTGRAWRAPSSINPRAEITSHSTLRGRMPPRLANKAIIWSKILYIWNYIPDIPLFKNKTKKIWDFLAGGRKWGGDNNILTATFYEYLKFFNPNGLVDGTKTCFNSHFFSKVTFY